MKWILVDSEARFGGAWCNETRTIDISFGGYQWELFIVLSVHAANIISTNAR